MWGFNASPKNLWNFNFLVKFFEIFDLRNWGSHSATNFKICLKASKLLKCVYSFLLSSVNFWMNNFSIFIWKKHKISFCHLWRTPGDDNFINLELSKLKVTEKWKEKWKLVFNFQHLFGQKLRNTNISFKKLKRKWSFPVMKSDLGIFAPAFFKMPRCNVPV